MASGIETVFTAERAMAATVLIVDDENITRELCRDIVVESGLRTRTASTTEQALEILEQYPVDIVITDLRVPEIGGLELLKRVRETHPQTPVIVLTQYGTIESAVEATRHGAADYVTKPFHIPELRTKLDRVVRSLELDQENRVLREQLRTRPGFAGLIGLSPKMQRVYRLIEKVSQHNYPVLILGESGTGKELVARSIHFSGTRSGRPFAPVDCSSFVPTLIESELFGYVKGAFTGANQTKRGLMEAAGNPLALIELPRGLTPAQLDFFHSTNAAAVSSVVDAIESQVERLLPEGISKSARNRVVGEIYRELDTTLRGNRALGQQMRNAFRSGGLDDEHQRAIVSLVTGRARQALPAVAKRVLNEWTTTVVSANHERRERQRTAERRVDIAGSGGAGNDGRRAVTPRELDYARMSDADILNL